MFRAVLFTAAKIWKQPRCPSAVEWIRKSVVHIHNGILLSYEKGHIWVNPNEVDETGAYYIERSQKEKTPIQYVNAYIWNLERWQWQPYMQDSKRDTDVKNRLLDYVGEGKGRMIWQNSIEMYITICKIDDQCKFNAWSRALKAADRVGRVLGGGFRMGDTCASMADSCRCMAKTTTILKSNKPPIKINK